MKTSPVVIVLAAGSGARYLGPRHKLSERLDEDSVLAHTVGHAIASGLPVLVVTTPALADEAARLVARRDLVILPSAPGRAGAGMGDSIAAGVAARSSASAWLIQPADMPLVRPETHRQVARAVATHAVAFAQYKGRRGHPVAFSAELFSELVRLTGEDGARRVLARYPAHGVEVPDPGVLIDVDTEADLAQLRQRLAQADD